MRHRPEFVPGPSSFSGWGVPGPNRSCTPSESRRMMTSGSRSCYASVTEEKRRMGSPEMDSPKGNIQCERVQPLVLE